MEYRFYQNYTGPTKHLGGYVTVAGFDSVGAILWEIPSYTVGTPTQPNVSVPFSPQQLNPLTADVGITVAFPTNFGSGSLATYTVSNLSLSLDFPSVPSGTGCGIAPFSATLIIGTVCLHPPTNH